MAVLGRRHSAPSRVSARLAHRARAAGRPQAEHAVFRLRGRRPQGRRHHSRSAGRAYANSNARRRRRRRPATHRDEAGRLFVSRRQRPLVHGPRPESMASRCTNGFCWRPSAADKDLTTLINVEVPESALRGLFRRGRPQGAGERHVPPDADRGAARLVAVQARTSCAGFRVMKVFPGGVHPDRGAERRPEPAALCHRLGRARRAGTARRPRRASPAICCRRRRCAIFTVQSADAMRIGGAPGYEIRAQAEGAQRRAGHGGAMAAISAAATFCASSASAPRTIGTRCSPASARCATASKSAEPIRQNLMVLRTPAIKALPTVMLGLFGSGTLPPGCTMYCRSGCTVHHGAICA